MSLQVETAEAIASALYGMPFSEFLGEDDRVDSEGEMCRMMWFHLGERPKDIRVTIIRPERHEEVRLLIEWRNYFADGRNPLKGERTVRITTYAATQAMLGPATQEAVLRVLETYRDVLGEEGVAGQIGGLAEEEAEASHGVNSEE